MLFLWELLIYFSMFDCHNDLENEDNIISIKDSENSEFEINNWFCVEKWEIKIKRKILVVYLMTCCGN